MCKTINLDVKVSPRFVDQYSSQNIVAREGDTVTLICNVTGKPEPEVTWQRRIVTGGKVSYAVESLVTVGPRLVLGNVTRFCSSLYFVYECFANNGVPPAISRQIRLAVEFAPELNVNTRSTWQRREKEVTLECTVAAFPMGDVYWERHQRLVTSSDRHAIDLVENPDNTVTLRIVIRELTPLDFGDYKCVATNRLNKKEEIVTILEHMDAEKHHLATASKLESALEYFTPTKSTVEAPPAKQERNIPSSGRLTVPSDSSRTDELRGSCLVILLWSIGHLAANL